MAVHPLQNAMTESEEQRLARELELTQAAAIVRGFLEELANATEMHEIVVEQSLSRLSFWSEAGRSWLASQDAQRETASWRDRD